VRRALVALLAGACTGRPVDDGDTEPFEQCTAFNVLATVYTPMGELVDDAEVEYTVVIGMEITDTPCASNGDGTYLCIGHMGSDNQQVSAFPSETSTEELQGAAIKVQRPAHCDETVSVDVHLMPDGMA
jgi:hypothetical protein